MRSVRAARRTGWTRGWGRAAIVFAAAAAAAPPSGPAEVRADQPPATRPASADPEIEELILQLASRRPDQRRKASAALVELGERARVALRRAQRSPDPAISFAAGDVLQQLPWYRPTDPPAVRELLTPYALMTDEERVGVVNNLANAENFPRDEVRPVLVRLLKYDGTDAVGWRVVDALQYEPAATLRDLLDDVRPGDADAPVPALYLAGWATWRTDRPAGVKLLRAAFDRLADPAGLDPEVVNRMGLILAADAEQRQAWDDAVAIRWRQLSLVPNADGVVDLLMIHARHATGANAAALAARLGGDLRRAFADAPFEARVAAACGAIADARGNRLLGDALEHVALATAATNDAALLELGTMGTEHALDTLAQRALNELTAPNANPNPPNRATAADKTAHLRQHELAIRRGDHLAAARHLEAAYTDDPEVTYSRRSEFGPSTPWTRDQVLSEIHYRYLRAARARGDRAEMDRRLTAVLPIAASEPSFVVDLLTMYKELGRHADADALFDETYGVLARQLDETPDDPELLNEFAWLCARSGYEPARGLAMAKRAVELEPESSSFLDTLAEAHFRTGNAAEAVKLEEKALSLKPNDPFMLKQLERFKSGKPVGHWIED
jgi:tetratricopeptide (TPR) repeat protein